MQKLQGLNILLGGKLVLVEGWFGQEVGLVLNEKIGVILGEHQDSFGNYFQWKSGGGEGGGCLRMDLKN